jgi:outer membrane protein assembly factor BamB
MTLKRKVLHMTKTAAAFALLVLAAAPAGADSMFRGDPAHTGTSSAVGPRELHGVRWRFVTGGRVNSSPAWSSGTVYVGSDDGNLYAVDGATGRERWKYATSGPVASSPAVVGSLVYFGSYDGKFYALEAESGKLRWRFETGGERRFEGKNLHGWLPKSQTFADPFDTFLSSPVVGDGAVFFGSGDGNVYALDAATGSLRWKVGTGDVVHASPAYADGVVYVGSWDSFFYALDARTGKERWRFKGGEDPVIHNQVGFQSSPSVVAGIVYTGCRDSNLYALDAATGKEMWRFNNEGSWVVVSPAVKDGRVVFATSDSALLHVLDAQSGKPVFRQDTKAYVFSSPTIAGDTAYFGVMNGVVEARDVKTGSLLWSFRTDASKENRGWILTAEGRFNGQFSFYSPWREVPLVGTERQFGVGSFLSTPLVADGMVIVGSADGTLYALN